MLVEIQTQAVSIRSEQSEMEGVMDFIFAPWSWYLMPTMVLLISLLVLRHRRTLIRVVAALLFSIATFAFFFMGAWGWLLRDGLGPDMESSHGWKALSNFLDPLLFIIPGTPLAVGLLLCWKNRARQNEEH